MYLRFLLFSEPCGMRKPSEVDIWRTEDIYSLNARPFTDKDDLSGMIDPITLERDVLFSPYFHINKFLKIMSAR